MDEKNRRILEVLQRDARTPIKAIAATVGLARSSVRERLLRMERDGLIRGYRVELGSAGDPGIVEAFLLLRLDKTPSPRTIARIVTSPHVVRCSSVGGETDVVVEVRVTDIATLNRVRDEIADYPNVADLTTALILKRDK
jgi:DNA-binding Lrp family transcriptional regulator